MLVVVVWCFFFCFFFNDTATTEIYTLSLHDALLICVASRSSCWRSTRRGCAWSTPAVWPRSRHSSAWRSSTSASTRGGWRATRRPSSASTASDPHGPFPGAKGGGGRLLLGPAQDLAGHQV